MVISGLIFSVACLAFNIIFRKKRSIQWLITLIKMDIIIFYTLRVLKLSSPNLNYLIILGSDILYVSVFTFTYMPSNVGDFTSATVICNVSQLLYLSKHYKLNFLSLVRCEFGCFPLGIQFALQSFLLKHGEFTTFLIIHLQQKRLVGKSSLGINILSIMILYLYIDYKRLDVTYNSGSDCVWRIVNTIDWYFHKQFQT